MMDVAGLCSRCTQILHLATRWELPSAKNIRGTPRRHGEKYVRLSHPKLPQKLPTRNSWSPHVAPAQGVDSGRRRHGTTWGQNDGDLTEPTPRYLSNAASVDTDSNASFYCPPPGNAERTAESGFCFLQGLAMLDLLPATRQS